MSWNAEHLADFREMLVQQYLLHEMEHHVLQSDISPGQITLLLPVAFDLVDIYKCLHQGEFGVGHTIAHPESFKQRLYQEITELDVADCTDEPALENISADGNMLRINLRPLKRLHEDALSQAVEDLADVCIRSARIIQGDPIRFFETLDIFRTLNRKGEIAVVGYVFVFPPVAVDAFLSDVWHVIRRIRDAPALTHSEAYRRLNRPAYRVVDRSALEGSRMASLLAH